MLEILADDPCVSRIQIAELLGDISEDGVKYQLAKLKKRGLIRRIGPDKGGRWEVLK
jgi:ATP-dependent DNA helicase RecG